MKKEIEVDYVNKMIAEWLEESEKELVSDWYHTFKELYAHRVALFVALCNMTIRCNDWHNDDSERESAKIPEREYPWKSKLHADGTMFDWWFIAGIGTEKWKTLTYHLPMSEWNNLDSIEVWHAPEWDWHTSDDVLRLLKYL